ncbi:MAG: hypothetical protein WD872_19500 [Pirellulaceae bacterium]
MRSLPLVFAAASPASWTTWFASDFGNAGVGGGGAGGVNPYAGGAFGQTPPPRRSSKWPWILGIIGIGGLLLCGCCGGTTYFFYSFGTGVMTEELKKEVAADPNVEQHLGEIQSLTIDLFASAEEAEKRGSSQQVLLIKAKGSKGSGEFIVEQSANPQPGAMFDKIDLRLPSGEEISIK